MISLPLKIKLLNVKILNNNKILMIVLFLEGKIKDYEGRYLNDIWSFDDAKIENVHNFIQWIFPLDQMSKFVPSSPVLIDEEILEVKQSSVAKENLILSKQWFYGFLKRTSEWELEKNHNHARISRMIKSLKLLHSDNAAKKCLDEVLHLAASRSFNAKRVIYNWKKCIK